MATIGRAVGKSAATDTVKSDAVVTSSDTVNTATINLATFNSAAINTVAQPIWLVGDGTTRGDSSLSSGWAFFRTLITVPVDDPVCSATLMATASSTKASRQFIYRMFVEDTCLGVGPVFPVSDESRLDRWDITCLVQQLQHEACAQPGLMNTGLMNTDVANTELPKAGLTHSGSVNAGSVNAGAVNVGLASSDRVNSGLSHPTFSFGIGAQCWALNDRRFLAFLEIHFLSGKTMRWGTNSTTWRGLSGEGIYREAPSLGTFYFTAPQEHCDTSQYPFGFSCARFDATGWQQCVEQPSFVRLELNPMAQTEVKNVPCPQAEPLSAHILDFHRTILGGVRVQWKFKQPISLRLHFAEVCDEEGAQYQLNTSNTYEDVWNLSAGEHELSTWGLRVFRYCQLDVFPDYKSALSGKNFLSLADIPGEIEVQGCSIEYTRHAPISKPTLLNLPALNSPMCNSRGLNAPVPNALVPKSPVLTTSTSPSSAQHVFQCSDSVLQQIFDMSAQTIFSCTGPMYVDSWTRERASYEADAYLHLRAHNALDFSPKIGEYTALWLLHHRTWPTEWPMYLVLMIHRLWAMGQSDNLVRTQWQHIQQLLPLKHLTNGHIEKQPGNSSEVDGDLVDWPESERDGFVFSRANTVVNALASAAFRAAGELAARAMGESELASRYLSLSRQISSAIERFAWNEKYGYADGLFLEEEGLPVHYGEHALAAVLAFCPPHEEKKLARIREIVRNKKHIHGSVYEAALLMEGLINIGEARLACELMAADGTLHSWKHMLTLGSGSMPEAWDASIKPNLTYSHPWAASPAYLLPLATVGDAAVSTADMRSGAESGGAEDGSVFSVPAVSAINVNQHTLLIDTCGLDSVSSRVPTSWGSIDVEWQADRVSGKLEHLHIRVNADAVAQHTAFAGGVQPCSHHSSQLSGTQTHEVQPSVRVLLSPECVPDVPLHCVSSTTSTSIAGEGIAPVYTVVTVTEWVGNRLIKKGSWDLGTFAAGDYHFF